MVGIQTWLAGLFILIMILILYKYRSKVTVHKFLGPLLYFVMLKTELGLKAMDYLGSKWRTFFKWFGYFSVVLGFAGMLLIVYQLVKSTVLLFISPGLAPGIQLVLPFQAKGVFFVPFAYWIISIFVIAVVHEFAHGVLARAHKIKVKSSGFAFLGILVPVIPAAFVEPDDKELRKRPVVQQLSVFAAGPGANIVMALLMIFAFGIASPIIPYSVTQQTAIWDITEVGTGLITFSGFTINKVEPGSPADRMGLSVGQTITSLNGVSITEQEEILEIITTLKPGQSIVIGIGDQEYTSVLDAHPEDSAKGYIGIGFDTETMYAAAAVEKYGNLGVGLLLALISMILWIFILSLGIGLFNLIPLGPIDGGRMFKLVVERFTKSEKQGTKIWKWVSFGILGMILINMIIGFIS